MSQFDPWDRISAMATDARSTDNGIMVCTMARGYPVLKLWRQGAITRFFVGEREVVAPEFASQLSFQHEAKQEVQAEVQSIFKLGTVAATPESENADRPAMPRDFFDEYGLKVAEEAGLTKREYAEVHALASALTKIEDTYEAVSYAKQAVSILMEEWAERESNA